MLSYVLIYIEEAKNTSWKKKRKKRNDILFSVYNGFLASATGRRRAGRCDPGSNPFKIEDDPDPWGSIHEKSIKKDTGHIRIGIF